LAKTLGQQLDRVQEAIDKLESGTAQSYEIEGRKMTYLDLPALYKREEYLLKQIENYGRDYTPGQNTKPVRRNIIVSFG